VEIGKDLAGSPGEAIALSGRQSVDSDGEITEYVWDTGDGGKERGREAWHSYEKPGKYLVTLTIQDDAGTYNSSASDQLTVVINDRPEAVFANDRTVVSVNEAINFDASGSFDRDGKITEYYWNFGDNNTATGSTVAHGYEYSGKYTVTLKIKDNSGTSSEYNETSKVMVINYPPVAKSGEDQWVTSSEVSFDASASSDYDGEITKYLWDFGDSFKSGEKMPVHIYSNPGKYLVKLTVTDDSKTSTKDHSDNSR
jgi:PKD repeat protein